VGYYLTLVATFIILSYSMKTFTVEPKVSHISFLSPKLKIEFLTF